MALPLREKNKKLKATPSGEPMAAQVALAKLNKKAKYSMIYSEVGGPHIPQGGVKYHLQGMAVLHGTSSGRNRVFLTTSAKSGKIITGLSTVDKQHYIVDREAMGYDTEDKVHPGGIQIIGHYLVIPIYYKQYSGIEIRDIDNELSIVKQFRTERNPYCVGITTTHDKTGEYYVLAVVTHNKGRRVDIYRTPSGLELKDPKCFFELRWTYKASPKNNDPKKDWNGYANNISLLSDTKGNIYFFGFYNSSQLGTGKNYVDLYHMDLSQPEDKIFRRLGRIRAKTDKGSFRFGGSASVIGTDALEIYACKKNVNDVIIDKRTELIETDLLSA